MLLGEGGESLPFFLWGGANSIAKFGSDLDGVVELTIEGGHCEQELLKQGQYQLLDVEQRIAI